MFYMNTRQSLELDRRLKNLGFDTEHTSMFKTIDYEAQIPSPNLITLFAEGKLEDPTPEFRKNLRKMLMANYEAHVLVPITKKYETQMKHGIEAWTYEYNITRLNLIFQDDYDISFNARRNTVNIPIVDTDGYGIEAEIRGAKNAVEAYKNLGYNTYVSRSLNGGDMYICIVLKK